MLDETIGIAEAKVEELKREVESDAKEVTGEAGENEEMEEEKAAKQLASKQAELKTLEKMLEGFQQLHDGKL